MKQATTFESERALVAGTGFINTLDDDDILTGTGNNAVLNVEFGAENDISDDSNVQPTLINIKTVNAEWTANDTTSLNLSDADSALANVNINRITATNAAINVEDMGASVRNVRVKDATKGGSVTLDWREEVLTGAGNSAETLNLALDAARVAVLTLQEGGDGAADQGQFFETINVNSTGNNDIDRLNVQSNGREDLLNNLANDTTKQALNFNVTSGSLEINNLQAPGVDTMAITVSAGTRLDIAADKAQPLSAMNDGITTPDLESVTISGAGAVMIDGLDTTEQASGKTLTVNAANHSGGLKLGVISGADGLSSTEYEYRTDKDLSVTTGSGNDEIVIYSNLAGDITTNNGNDIVSITSQQGLTDGDIDFDLNRDFAFGDFITLQFTDRNGTAVGSSFTVTVPYIEDDDNRGESFAALIASAINQKAVELGVTDAVVGVDTASDDDVDIDYEWSAGYFVSVLSSSFTGNLESGSEGVNHDNDGQLLAAPGWGFNDAFEQSGEQAADMEGVSTINTGLGNDTVTAQDMLVTATDFNEENNGGFDDVQAARIITDAGNDVVSVRDLTSGEDYDNRDLEDANADDVYKVIGASISTGAGNDTITLRTMAEGTLVDAGADNDTVNVSINPLTYTFGSGGFSFDSFEDYLDFFGPFDINDPLGENGNASIFDGSGGYNFPMPFNVHTVLEGDTNADNDTVAGNNREVNLVNGNIVADRLGAILDLGAGTADVANFIESESFGANIVTIVGRDAEIRGAETINVQTLGWTNVTTSTTAGTDENANVIGTRTLNLTAANQIGLVTAFNTGLTANEIYTDNGLSRIDADIQRFDATLANINLVSDEIALRQSARNEVWEAGTRTNFDLDNLRTNVALSLKANEATGVENGVRRDDTLLSIDSVSGAVTTDADAADVSLDLNYYGATAADNSHELNVLSSSAAFDLDLNIGTGGLDGSVLENFTINFADTNSHSINANGFGDGTSQLLNQLAVGSPVVTSFIVETAAVAGNRIDINNVDADVVRVLNVSGNAGTAANVTLRLSNENVYNIQTGSGTDIIDMRADIVQADDSTTVGVNEADTITAGAGRDILIVDGFNNMGINDLAPNTLSSVATQINDDVFVNISGVETLMISATNGAGGSSNTVVLDEAAAATGIDTIRIVDSDSVGGNAHGMTLVIGNNFVISPTAANGELTTAASALVIDAAQHDSQTNINIENKDDDTDIATINLDIRVNAEGGADLRLFDLGTAASRTEVRIKAAVSAVTDIDDNDATDSIDGVVDILVDSGESIDKIVMTGVASNQIDVDASNSWAITDDTLEFDADTELTESGNGHLDFNGVAVTGYKLIVRGTTGDDVILGGSKDDSILGNNGNDTLNGGAAGADTLDGGSGNNTYVFNNSAVTGDTVVFNTAAGATETMVLDGSGNPAQLDMRLLNAGALLTGLDVIEIGDNDIGTFKFDQLGTMTLVVDGDDSIDSSGSSSVLQVLGTADGATTNDTIDLRNITMYDSQTLVFGNDGNDLIYGTTLIGEDNDFGGSGSASPVDEIYGGAGQDTVYGGNGEDTISGGADADLLYGGNDNDVLLGDEGADVIYGDAGADFIDGGEGRDTLFGGSGSDTFYYENTGEFINATVGNDSVTDLVSGGGDAFDRILIDGGAISIGGYALGGIDASGGGTVENGSDTLARVTGVLTLEQDESSTTGTSTYIRIDEDDHLGSIRIFDLDQAGGVGSYVDLSALTSARSVTVLGASGSDVIFTGEGNDSVDGNGGNDYISTIGGNDTITSDTGYSFTSNPGTTIIGGSGADTINLDGLGRNIVVFDDGDSTSSSMDVISGFSINQTYTSGASSVTINDVIDLIAVDADGTNINADQNFVYLNIDTLSNHGNVSAFTTAAGNYFASDANGGAGGTPFGDIYVARVGSDIYIAADNNDNGVYNAGVDVLIRLVGVGVDIGSFDGDNIVY